MSNSQPVNISDLFFWLTVNPTYKELSARWEVDSTPDARATAPTATRRSTCTKAPLDSGTQLTPGMIQQVPRTRGDRAIMKHSSQLHLLYRGTTATWMNSTVSYFLKYNSSLKKTFFDWNFEQRMNCLSTGQV